jgi:hypothetical protein
MKIGNELVYFVRRLAMNTTTKLFGIFSVAALGAILPCSTLFAATIAGQVQFTIGTVQVTTAEGNVHLLKKGDTIYEGDTINTIVASSAQIKMKDGGFIAVRHDTKMRFDKFVFKGNQNGEERSFYSLFKGGFRAVTGLIGGVNKQNYKIVTPAATIGIRGTDHETYFVPTGTALVQSGAYSKVNVGETTLTTNQGTINVLPNQMGFSSGMNEVPKLAPINTNIFTVAATPTKTMKDSKADKSNQADQSNTGANQQSGKQEAKQDNSNAGGGSPDGGTKEASNTNDPGSIRQASTDSTISNSRNVTTGGAAPATLVSDTLNLRGPALSVPIVMTNPEKGTLNVTTQTTTSSIPNAIPVPVPPIPVAAYAGNQIALETISTLGFGYGNSWGALVAPANLTFVAGGSSASGALQTYIQQNIGGGSNWTNSSTITGGTATSSNAPSFATTGIQYGAWTGYTGQTFTNTMTLGGKNENQTNWMYAPQGYIDSANYFSVFLSTPMSGNLNYVLDGSNLPRYQNSGVAGTLYSASLTANFSSLTVSATLGLNIGTDFWGANMTGKINSLAGPSFNGTTTVSRGTSISTLATCLTCSGNLNGMFTGQNFAGAILSYSLSDTSTGSSVNGDAAFAGSFTPAPGGTLLPTGNIVIECGAGCVSTTPSTSVTTVSNVLTQYGFGSATNGSSVTVSCPLCTATAAGLFASSGIFYGTWTSGTYSSTNTLSGSTSPAYWITGPEAGPLYLSQALIGTVNYVLDAGQVSNTAGVAGTVNATTALTVNFTNQTVGINLNASVTDAVSAQHTWIATATTHLTGNQGIGGGAFHASTYGGSNNGLLTVTVDGSTVGAGNIDGQLTGSGLTGAIISFSLNVTAGSVVNAAYADSISGIAAFSGTAQNINTPYQTVLMANYDSVTSTPALGFYFNNAANAIQDAAGNLTKFDSNFVNSGSSNNVTLTNTGSTLTDFGKDSATGISWGRWQGGTLNVTSRATGLAISTTVLPLNASLHWITEPLTTSAVTLPVSGTYAYTYAGGTKPTDSLGNIGTLNSASVTANFTAQTVNAGVNVSVNSATLNATATNAPIIQNTVFYASSVEPSTSASYLNVSCTGSCGAVLGGTVIGKFTGASATGVAMSYGLQNGTSVVNGVAALHR